MRTGFDNRKMLIQAKKLLYSQVAQTVRLEWIERSGGTYKPAFDSYSGETESGAVSDNVRAIIHVLKLNDLRLIENKKFELGDAIIRFAPDLNLASKEKLVIVEKIQNLAAQGLDGWQYKAGDWDDYSSASATGGVIDFGTDMGWSTNAIKGWSLIMDNARYEITANTDQTITIGSTPALTGSFEVCPVVLWYPVIDQAAFGNLYRGGVLQEVYCKRTATHGGVREY